MYKRWVQYTVAVVVTFVWAGSYIASWFNPQSAPSALLHAVMMAMITALFTSASMNKKDNET